MAPLIPLSVKAFMDTWSNKMGYPVVTVTRNYRTGQALVEQVRSFRCDFDDSFILVISTGTFFVEEERNTI